MKTTYAVVWRDGDAPIASGRLEFHARSITLAGASNGRPVDREVGFAEVSSVRVGRARKDRLDGKPTLVLEREGRDDLRVAPLSAPGILAELAHRLAALPVGLGC
jgi:hypothetical protein